MGQPSNANYLVKELASGGMNYMFWHEIYHCRSKRFAR